MGVMEMDKLAYERRFAEVAPNEELRLGPIDVSWGYYWVHKGALIVTNAKCWLMSPRGEEEIAFGQVEIADMMDAPEHLRFEMSGHVFRISKPEARAAEQLIQTLSK